MSHILVPEVLLRAHGCKGCELFSEKAVAPEPQSLTKGFGAEGFSLGVVMLSSLVGGGLPQEHGHAVCECRERRRRSEEEDQAVQGR